jgi:hypothetical protein
MSSADLPRFDLTPEGVSAALADLDKGGSEDVAMRLEELGIRGRQDSGCACPIAEYLLQVVPGMDSVTVERESAYVYGIRYDLDDPAFPIVLGPLHITLPDSVSAFVADFDQGCFPQLVLSTEEVAPNA